MKNTPLKQSTIAVLQHVFGYSTINLHSKGTPMTLINGSREHTAAKQLADETGIIAVYPHPTLEGCSEADKAQ